MAVDESARLLKALRKDNIPCKRIVVNQVILYFQLFYIYEWSQDESPYLKALCKKRYALWARDELSDLFFLFVLEMPSAEYLMSTSF